MSTCQEYLLYRKLERVISPYLNSNVKNKIGGYSKNLNKLENMTLDELRECYKIYNEKGIESCVKYLSEASGQRLVDRKASYPCRDSINLEQKLTNFKRIK
ncbi:hypothetical protein HGP29_27040 [Flammeovirga sp. SR4]|uniref:Uncharacterized protein n=1 Tax=Flammeovirga agarivorans TaxID=2726742 RepID=A0A7X8XZ66_9BACT|nr:hypothetical protein [Flammeovirga agarivorans]